MDQKDRLNIEWKYSDYPSQIFDNEVHVWRYLACIDKEPEPVLISLLNEDEKARAMRYHFLKDKVIYITGRAMLRSVIGRYKRKNPSEINFYTNDYGKLYLCTDDFNREISFNLSHSHRGILIALAIGCEIGVDLEFHRSDIPLLEIAERFFSPSEVRTLKKLPSKDHLEAFYNCWTRKEAFIKAKGMGLSIALDRFNVTFNPSEDQVRLSFVDEKENADHWTIYNLVTWSSYSAAVCINAKHKKFLYWNWNEDIL